MRAFFVFLMIECFMFSGPVSVGLEEFFNQHIQKNYKDKKAGLITNHTGIDPNFQSTLAKFDDNEEGPQITTIFFPEHGLTGAAWAEEELPNHHTKKRKIYSLHNKTRRPDDSMLKELEVIFYDIQDIGARSYTYISTLFYAMEEAKKHNIEIVVLDRPNPMGGLLVDGPMLDNAYKSFIGYINVPYCHGMTVGELATFFNKESGLNCKLTVVKMKGWKRDMIFGETKLPWVPTSPNIPESDTPFFYATTGLFDSLHLVNIGVGYTLPFKIIGTPFIDKDKFTKALIDLNLPGVKFLAFSFKPFYGRYKGDICHGVKIIVSNPHEYLPVKTSFALMGILKSMYPTQFSKALSSMTQDDLEMFYKICGTQEVYNILKNEKFPTWKLLTKFDQERQAFLEKRAPFLLY
jgi:uncharacterized protein YbbC (DUF1343 family)